MITSLSNFRVIIYLTSLPANFGSFYPLRHFKGENVPRPRIQSMVHASFEMKNTKNTEKILHYTVQLYAVALTYCRYCALGYSFSHKTARYSALDLLGISLFQGSASSLLQLAVAKLIKGWS